MEGRGLQTSSLLARHAGPAPLCRRSKFLLPEPAHACTGFKRHSLMCYLAAARVNVGEFGFLGQLWHQFLAAVHKQVAPSRVNITRVHPQGQGRKAAEVTKLTTASLQVPSIQPTTLVQRSLL